MNNLRDNKFPLERAADASPKHRAEYSRYRVVLAFLRPWLILLCRVKKYIPQKERQHVRLSLYSTVIKILDGWREKKITLSVAIRLSQISSDNWYSPAAAATKNPLL